VLLVGVRVGTTAGVGPTTRNDFLFLSYAQQHRLFLSTTQENAIVRSVRRQRGKAVTLPAGFEVGIGQAVPRTVTLHRFPIDATNRVWAVKPYNYVLLRHQLLIVSPQNRRIVAIITQ
jgi:hypothetical protein